MGIEMLADKREDILRLAEKHGASNVRVFGSVARGEAGPNSDIDVLVHMEDGRSYFDVVNLLDALEALLGRTVDIVDDDGLSPYLKERILAEAIQI
jgi:predicted nucleotidyltransferase